MSSPVSVFRRVFTYIEVLGVKFAVLGQVVILLGDEYTLYLRNVSKRAIVISDNVFMSLCLEKGFCIPRKRYSWIFLRSALGISLE